MEELSIAVDVDALGNAELSALFQALTRFSRVCASLEPHEHAVVDTFASAFSRLLGDVTTEMHRRVEARRAVDAIETVADLGWDAG